MVFTSTVFLFLFLPVTLVVYFAAARAHRNFILLVASLIFYFWGEAGFVTLMVASAAVNYVFGLLLEQRKQSQSGRFLLALVVIINLAPLLFFKYTVLLVTTLREVTGFAGFAEMTSSGIHLPIGISFFTFQAISYVVDVYRGTARAQKNPLDLALYIALFPQLIAGPIVRYNEIAAQISERTTRVEDVRAGVERFIIGLGKKVLIANVMGAVADDIFATPTAELAPAAALLGVVAYALQIYFDFSGYSDMAIGLGRIFGFRFAENFNYPYSARSVTEFWRRWHISLSRWFRDYLYIPLGGNRHGHWRTGFNLLTVFVLCGLWHGAAWVFLAWGLFHGLFLVVERVGLGLLLNKLPSPAQRGYTIVVVLMGWVFFRSPDIAHAFGYFGALVSFDSSNIFDAILLSRLTPEFWITLGVAIVFSFPVWPSVARWRDRRRSDAQGTGSNSIAIESIMVVALSAITVFSAAAILSSGYNPFLYFRF